MSLGSKLSPVGSRANPSLSPGVFGPSPSTLQGCSEIPWPSLQRRGARQGPPAGGGSGDAGSVAFGSLVPAQGRGQAARCRPIRSLGVWGPCGVGLGLGDGQGPRGLLGAGTAVLSSGGLQPGLRIPLELIYSRGPPSAALRSCRLQERACRCGCRPCGGAGSGRRWPQPERAPGRRPRPRRAPRAPAGPCASRAPAATPGARSHETRRPRGGAGLRSARGPDPRRRGPWYLQPQGAARGSGPGEPRPAALALGVQTAPRPTCSRPAPLPGCNAALSPRPPVRPQRSPPERERSPQPCAPALPFPSPASPCIALPSPPPVFQPPHSLGPRSSARGARSPIPVLQSRDA